MKYRSMKYRNKTIKAVRFEGFRSVTGQAVFNERPDWLISEFGERIIFFDERNILTIKTHKGSVGAAVGDYIVKGVQGELSCYKPDIFHMTYEEVAE